MRNSNSDQFIFFRPIVGAAALQVNPILAILRPQLPAPLNGLASYRMPGSSLVDLLAAYFPLWAITYPATCAQVANQTPGFDFM